MKALFLACVLALGLGGRLRSRAVAGEQRVAGGAELGRGLVLGYRAHGRQIWRIGRRSAARPPGQAARVDEGLGVVARAGEEQAGEAHRREAQRQGMHGRGV